MHSVNVTFKRCFINVAAAYLGTPHHFHETVHMRTTDVNPQELVSRLQERLVVLLRRLCENVVIDGVFDEAGAGDDDSTEGGIGNMSEEGLIQCVVEACKAFFM